MQRKNSTDENRTKRKRSQTKGRNLADRDNSVDAFREASRQSKAVKKRRKKSNVHGTVNSGDAAPTNGEVDDDDTFINNDISDEETMPMEARPFDRDLESRPPRRSHARTNSNSAASNGELRVSFLDDDGGFDSRNMTRLAEPTKSASERMQEFLDKNSSDAPVLDAMASSSQPRGDGPRRRQRAGTPSEGLGGESSNQNKQNRRDRSGKHRSEITPIPSEALSPEVLFSDLAERQPSASSVVPRGVRTARENIPPAPSNHQASTNSSDICEQLKSAYKSSPRNAVSLLTRLELHHSEAQGDSISRVLDSLLKLVQEEGATTLLDVIANGPSEQAKTLHIKLLVAAVNFIAMQSTHGQENSSSSHLCGVVPQQKFVEEILLQTIDVLYAYFAPVAWANSIRDKISSSSLGALRELAVSIGKIVPLIETVSRILVSCQQVQKWYRSSLSPSESERFFVSSVDPSKYASFLKTGERAKTGKSNEMDTSGFCLGIAAFVLTLLLSGIYSPATFLLSCVEQNDLRFAQFKMAIPRGEVNALWMIIAFFGNVPSIPASSSQWYRYKHIVRRLFYSDAAVLSNGALAQSLNIVPPPSKSHLSTCEIELLRLSALIRSGALDPLPEQDGILTSLIQKSLSLQADSYRHDANGAATDMIITVLDETSTKPLLRHIWEVSDVASVATPLLNIEAKLLAEVGSDISLPIESGGGILQACTALMMAWMGRLPADKKARWIRLRKDIDKLVATLTEKSDAIESAAGTLESRTDASTAADCVESAFEAAFGDKGLDASRNLQAGPDASAGFYRQSASLLLLSSTLFAAKKMHQPNEPMQGFDEDFLKRIWNMISNDDMRKHHLYVQNGRSGQEPAVSKDFLRSIVATKVMSIAALLYLGAHVDSEDTSNNDARKSGLTFVISSIASSLESLCHMFMAEVKRTAETTLFPTTDNSCGASFRPNSIMCISAISGGFTSLSTILSRARSKFSNFTLVNSSHADELDNIGSTCLLMIIPVVEVAFASIIQAKEANASSELCVRSVLATLRHGIGLFHALGKNADTPTAETLAAAVVGNAADSSSNTDQVTDDLFGGLGDDAFMNIDLDNLTGQSTSASSSQVETGDAVGEGGDAKMDELAKGKLWSLLMDALDAAKVSIFRRFFNTGLFSSLSD